MARDIEIKQGETYEDTIYWYSGDDVVVPITAVELGYPTTLTATAHGLDLVTLPVTILGAKGTTAINTESDAIADRIHATVIDADTVTIKVLTAASRAYTGQGYLIYTPPVDFTGWTARMKIRRSLSSETELVALDETDGITLGTDGSVLIIIDDATTAALSFNTGVYDLEVVSPTGVVKRLAEGAVTLSKEVTRPSL